MIVAQPELTIARIVMMAINLRSMLARPALSIRVMKAGKDFCRTSLAMSDISLIDILFEFIMKYMIVRRMDCQEIVIFLLKIFLTSP